MNRTLTFLLLSAFTGWAAIIPADRLGLWVPGQTVGVSGGIPTVFAGTNTITADGTGATDAAVAIATAVALADSNTVCYLPPGRYRLDEVVSMRPGRVLRGAGTNTVLMPVSTPAIRGYPFNVSDTYSATAAIITGYEKGSSNLLIGAELDAAIYAGGVGYLWQSNASYVSKTSGAQDLQQQMVKVVSITGSNIVIWPPVTWNMSNSLAPRFKAAPDAAHWERIGIEDMLIDMSQTTDGNAAPWGAGLTRCKNSWIKGVQVTNFISVGFYFLNDLFCEARTCFANTARATGPNHAGFQLYTTSGNLVVDSIGYRTFPGYEHMGLNSANAVLYSVFVEVDGGSGLIGGALYANHDAHPHMCLFEGNKVDVFQSDGADGSSSDMTLLRNWFTGTNSVLNQYRRGIDLRKRQYYYNIVGNLVGAPGVTWTYTNNLVFNDYAPAFCYSFGYGGIGAYDSTDLDHEVFSTAILLKNYDYANNAVPAAQESAETLPDSYAYAAKPSWWDSSPWPPYGPAVTTNRIPAETRLFGLNGGDTPVPPDPPLPSTNTATIRGTIKGTYLKQ